MRSAVLVPLRDNFGNTDAALLLVLEIVAVAAIGARMTGLLAAVSAALSFDYLLTPPHQRLGISDWADVETAALLLGVGVLAIREAAA